MLPSILKRTLSKIIEQETFIFPRTVETIANLEPEAAVIKKEVAKEEVAKENEIDDWKTLGESWRDRHAMPKEEGFAYKGNEPTMFGDWQHKGRTTDF